MSIHIETKTHFKICKNIYSVCINELKYTTFVMLFLCILLVRSYEFAECEHKYGNAADLDELEYNNFCKPLNFVVLFACILLLRSFDCAECEHKSSNAADLEIHSEKHTGYQYFYIAYYCVSYTVILNIISMYQ